MNEKGLVAHYSSLRNLANILSDQKIRMGSVKDLSDPRESDMTWLDEVGLGHQVESHSRELLKDKIGQVGKFLKLLCTVAPAERRPDQDEIEASIYGRPRMWAQYGDNFQGFCVILDKESLSAAIEKHAIKSKHLLQGRVDYYSGLSSVSGGVTIEYSPGEELTQENILDLISDNQNLHSLYLKKSEDWRDENEYRWLLYHASTDPVFVDIRSSIKAVVLGTRFPLNQRTQVKLYCANLGCDCYQLRYIHPRYEKILIS